MRVGVSAAGPDVSQVEGAVGGGRTFIFSMIDVLPLLSRPTIRMFTCVVHGKTRGVGRGGGRDAAS